MKKATTIKEDFLNYFEKVSLLDKKAGMLYLQAQYTGEINRVPAIEEIQRHQIGCYIAEIQALANFFIAVSLWNVCTSQKEYYIFEDGRLVTMLEIQ